MGNFRISAGRSVCNCFFAASRPVISAVARKEQNHRKGKRLSARSRQIQVTATVLSQPGFFGFAIAIEVARGTFSTEIALTIPMT
jgi:hypothetical protein